MLYRKHSKTGNFPVEVAKKWAVILHDPNTRCEICGVLNWWLKLQGFWKHGAAMSNQHLTLDHITPGVNDGNYRPLCFSCNTERGANVKTDAEVLMVMRRWYLSIDRFWNKRHLWWLNTKPGKGGRKCRNKSTERRNAKFAASRLASSESTKDAVSP